MPDIESMMNFWDKGALVLIFDGGLREPMIRPAAFVYAIPGGFVWVEPSYADPWGAASPGMHIRCGDLEATDDGFTMAKPDGLISVCPFDPLDPATEDEGAPLRWFADYLRENGLQWRDERERVRTLIAPSIEVHSAEAKQP